MCNFSRSLSGHKPAGCNTFFQSVGNAVHRLLMVGHACNLTLLDEGKGGENDILAIFRIEVSFYLPI